MKTHCPQNHEYTPDNTYVDRSGFRHCKTCRRERALIRRAGGPGRGINNSAKTHCPRNHEYTADNTLTYRGKRACRECARLNARRQVLRKYGLTPERFDALMKGQGSACGICFEPLVIGPQTHIDHDHTCCPGIGSCGECVRGILCGNCNSLLGMSNDNIDVLRSAIAYLESRNSTLIR